MDNLNRLNRLTYWALVVIGLPSVVLFAGAAAYFGYNILSENIEDTNVNVGGTLLFMGMAVAAAVATHIGFVGLRKRK